MDTNVSFLKYELASTIEQAVRCAVETVLRETARVVGSKLTAAHTAAAESHRENQSLRERLDISESELKAVRYYMTAAEKNIKQCLLLNQSQPRSHTASSEATNAGDTMFSLPSTSDPSLSPHGSSVTRRSVKSLRSLSARPQFSKSFPSVGLCLPTVQSEWTRSGTNRRRMRSSPSGNPYLTNHSRTTHTDLQTEHVLLRTAEDTENQFYITDEGVTDKEYTGSLGGEDDAGRILQETEGELPQTEEQSEITKFEFEMGVPAGDVNELGLIRVMEDGDEVKDGAVKIEDDADGPILEPLVPEPSIPLQQMSPPSAESGGGSSGIGFVTASLENPDLASMQMQRESPDKVHRCNVCGRGFRRFYCLKTHQRIHTAMANERTALLAHTSESAMSTSGQQEPGFVNRGAHSATPRSLNTFFGVIVPTVLSMFSIVLFLRTGFVVGHAGLLQGLIMLGVAYFIISLTILSICAISTNGAVEGGGAYFMISRSLGPEFGGSIGLMFYLAKVCACGVYVLGLVEAILNIFGRDPGSSVSEGIRVLPQGYWYTVLYAAVVLQLCLLVCLVGANMYSRTSFLILMVVTISLLTILISPLATGPHSFTITHQCGSNRTCVYNGIYTGFNYTTLRNNLGPGYSLDYSTNTIMSFATVFAVMFTSCTGIMAGANMSGELKNPSVAIPKGTIIAVSYTFCVYVILFLLVSSTCNRVLLTQDYGFFQRINIWPPFVIIGVYCASLSAAMCSLIGASRILHALALDQLFGLPLAPAAITSKSGNPWVAVVYTWALVQCVVFAGQLNFIAGLVTVFYLLAYAAVDLACLALEWASAPNFRPTFQYFSWHTCLLGIISCLVMMFVINPFYSSASIVVLLLLLLILHYRSPTSSWGYISQALIFHQVRKYLLMLDVRKEHVKFWRPQVLLMVANPRSSCQLITFVNQLKKGGLYVLGHVQLGDLDVLPSDPVQPQYNFWLSLVDKLGVKAFVDLTLSPSVRQGTQHLLRITGLGGMKPNTLILGFYDNCVPEDYFLLDPAFFHESGGKSSEGDDFGVDLPSLQAHFPPVRNTECPRCLSAEEYVGIISDAIKMGKNVCLGRYFFQLEGERDAMKNDDMERSIDVWPLNLLQPESSSYVDVCSLFLLQMACVLNMSTRFRRAKLRIFLCVEAASGDQGWMVKEETLRDLLGKLRIRASIKIVQWDTVVKLHGGVNEPWSTKPGVAHTEGQPDGLESVASGAPESFLSGVNRLLLEHSAQAAVRFLYLPCPPADSRQSEQYLAQLEVVTRDLGPTLLIHGLTPVTCTEL
ncbi:hypothetical protein AGOR_G00024920 [Albula goreensis]|uniref:Solute carrier family 12 member 9 n=1 Tax=Albula goreensis TaxID=1534307 RepID=A0A8T3E5F3_9TELE|nr:hypothetical protein AGOR_G00024920 [Albula goreensis]